MVVGGVGRAPVATGNASGSSPSLHGGALLALPLLFSMRGLGASTDHEFPARHMALEWVPSLCAVLPMGFASVSVCERGYPGLVLSGERAVQRCVDGNGKCLAWRAPGCQQ